MYMFYIVISYEEAQAHIGLSSHRKKNIVISSAFLFHVCQTRSLLTCLFSAPFLLASSVSPHYHFLDVFAYSRKTPINFVISVRPSIRMYQLGSNWMDLCEIWYCGLSRKSIETIQIWVKSDKNFGEFIENLSMSYCFLPCKVAIKTLLKATCSTTLQLTWCCICEAGLS
jgi:hypothetical protein